VLEDVTIEAPRDALGLLAGHQIDFFTGHSRMLRDRIARALPFWEAGMPGYHSVLGMHAFGLEETGDYARAEAAGRRGVELEPRDGWSQHAVAHVMEMQNRQADGIAWMRSNDQWAGDSFFQVHNWWHLALYHLEAGDIEAVLGLFDAEDGRGPVGRRARHGRRLGAALAAAPQGRRCRRPLDDGGGRLGGCRGGGLLRLQRRACGDGLRRRRAPTGGRGGAGGAVRGDGADRTTMLPSRRRSGMR
jgi:hypothetical protein